MTSEQKEKLSELWKIYGNHGPQFTIGNHKLIQKLLFEPDVHFEEVLKQYQEMFTEGGGGPKKVITDECIQALRLLLAVD